MRDGLLPGTDLQLCGARMAATGAGTAGGAAGGTGTGSGSSSSSAAGTGGSVSRKKDGGPSAKFWESGETVSHLEAVRLWTGKHYKKVGQLMLMLTTKLLLMLMLTRPALTHNRAPAAA